MLKDLSGNRIRSFIPLLLILSCVAIFGCTYLDNAGMNEWDYKMYQEGWQLEPIDNSSELRWINGPSINGTNNTNN